MGRWAAHSLHKFATVNVQRRHRACARRLRQCAGALLSVERGCFRRQEAATRGAAANAQTIARRTADGRRSGMQGRGAGGRRAGRQGGMIGCWDMPVDREMAI